jgi:hypothetical protein
MLQVILKDELAARAIEQARLKGYDTPEEYIADLLNLNDVDENDDDDEPVEFDEDLKTSFRLAFRDALRGKFYTYEEFKRIMAEDDDVFVK